MALARRIGGYGGQMLGGGEPQMPSTGASPQRRRLGGQQPQRGPLAPPQSPLPPEMAMPLTPDPMASINPGNVDHYLHANPEMMELLSSLTGKRF